MDKFHIPVWVSFKKYKIGGKERTYISNEKTHEFFVFDGISSKIWDCISKGGSLNDILSSSLGICNEDEINEFLLMLKELELLKNDCSLKKENNIENNLTSICDEKESIDFLAKKCKNLIRNNYLGELVLELTYNCNLGCSHCYNEKDINLKEEISFEDAKKIIDDASSLGVSSMILTGGECTITKDFLKIARYIREKRISLEIFTNGQTLFDNEKLFNDIVELYPYRVSLSLYSMNPEIHEKITKVKGSHSKTVSVIKKLRKKNVFVGIKCFLTSVNASAYSEISNFAAENGCATTIDCNFVPNPACNNIEMQATEEQFVDIFSNKSSSLRIKIPINKYTKNFKNSSVCMAGRKMLTVTPSLDVVCCPSFKKKIGDLKEESLIEIWKSSDKNSELNKIKKIVHSDLKECYTKDYCRYCTYCLGISDFVGKYMKKYDTFCKMAKIRMEAATLNRQIDKSK